MRAALCLLIALVAGCAAENELALAPPAGGDLSGHWRMNVADSDDPLRVTQALSAGQRAGASRGRGSRQNGQLPPLQPLVIPTMILADVLRWPGAEVEISQQGGVVTFISDGDSRIYRPPGPGPGAGRGEKKGRRTSAPPVCGWSGASLVVKVESQEDQPGFDARYRVSEDGRRLLQTITLQGGRVTGFTLSRVWERK